MQEKKDQKVSFHSVRFDEFFRLTDYYLGLGTSSKVFIFQCHIDATEQQRALNFELAVTTSLSL